MNLVNDWKEYRKNNVSEVSGTIKIKSQFSNEERTSIHFSEGDTAFIQQKVSYYSEVQRVSLDKFELIELAFQGLTLMELLSLAEMKIGNDIVDKVKK